MNPSEYITGLHHLTVCVGGAQEDIDFVTSATSSCSLRCLSTAVTKSSLR
ncbi:hypothetical protein [Eisenibacter elegans]|nr:hypothetical protein [Eisenibacter elegans]